MNELFAIRTHRDVRLLVYLPWWDAGILHGMTLADLDCKGDPPVKAVQSLCAALDVADLAAPRQVHGARAWDLRRADLIEGLLRTRGELFKSVEGDALIAPSQQPLLDRRLAFGVLAADCVPIVVRAVNGWAAIHAGWRGLACGIISAALAHLEDPVEAAIFAAAGGDAYEVGREVIDAIGRSAVYREDPKGGYLLDTAATAANQVREVMAHHPVETSGICTIRDNRFHSFRRQGESCGRSVTFVVPAG